MRLYHLALSLALSTTALAASPADWRSRSIYQVLTDRFARADGSTTATCDAGLGKYCGGSWKGIQRQLDYIQNMGFDAVWISPITMQLQEFTPYGDPYHGYWQQNIYEVNEHFGTKQDLKDLANALHSRGMYLMVDIVVNHFAYNGSPQSINYSKFTPFNSKSDYHDYCSPDYNNAESVRVCWQGDTTVSLPDLKTENQDIRDTWNAWIRDIVNDYGIDGLRLDTALQVRQDFWPGFNDAAGGLYMVGETYDGDSGKVCSYQDVMPGAMNYPLYFPMFDAFASTSGSMSAFVNMLNNVKNQCADTSLMGQFSENHDRPRFAGAQGDMALAKNLLAATMLTDGIPIIYEGQEQHYSAQGGQNNDPFNREAIWFSGYNRNAPLAQFITTMNKIRKMAYRAGSDYWNYRAWSIYQDNNTVALRKGKMISVLSNKGSNGNSYNLKLSSNVGVTRGASMTEMLRCKTVTADRSGAITVPMQRGLPSIYYPTADLKGTGICGN